MRHRDSWLATPTYWSPEQHAFGSGFWSSVDPDKADMFAFGAMIHIALTCTPPLGRQVRDVRIGVPCRHLRDPRDFGST